MKVCIIGCGSMGLIYADLLLKTNTVENSNLCLIAKNEIHRDKLQLQKYSNIKFLDDSNIHAADLIILAVKPQDFLSIKDKISGKINPKALVISIMAGISISFLQNNLLHNSCIRAMPNAPALFGKGMTVFCYSSALSEELINFGEQILSLTGKSIKTNDENILDLVTALSGSGPAYFFYQAKLLMAAAENIGMDLEMAEILVKQTLIGSAELVSNTNLSLDQLVKTVASKGGTTEAAINHFNSSGFEKIIFEGLQKATQRSKELAQELL